MKICNSFIIVLVLACFVGCNNRHSKATIATPAAASEATESLPENVIEPELVELEEPEDTTSIVADYSVNEGRAPIIHILYSRPVNGFTVSIDIEPRVKGDTLFVEGPAKMHFKRDESSFVIDVDCLYMSSFDGIPNRIKKAEVTTIRHRYQKRPDWRFLFDENPFYFADFDFDGQDELIIVQPLCGPRGMTYYQVFELDGTERKDRPLREIDDLSTFNFEEENIRLHRYHGVVIGSVELLFKHIGGGRFQLTDSTKIVNGIRRHYEITPKAQ